MESTWEYITHKSFTGPETVESTWEYMTHKSFTSPETMESTCYCLVCTPGPLSSVSCCCGRPRVFLILGLVCEPQPCHCHGSMSPLSCRSGVFNLPTGGLDENHLETLKPFIQHILKCLSCAKHCPRYV